MEGQLKNAEWANERAQQLTEQLNVKVHPIVFKESEEAEPVIGFLKEPNRMVKLAVLDKTLMGSFSAAAEMLDVILIKDESDPRLYSEKPEHDKFYLGAVKAAQDLIQISIEQSAAKKKN